MFNTDRFANQLHWLARNRIAHRLTLGSGSLRAYAAKEFNRSLERETLDSEASALLLMKGEFVFPETLRNLRRQGVRIVCYYPDNPFPPNSCNRPETIPAARETDLYLVWSERLVERLRSAGVPNPAFLPFGWDPELFPFQAALQQGAWPGVLFLGGWDREREDFLEELAARVPVRIYGPAYWDRRTRMPSRVRRCWQGSDLRGAAAARAIRESAVSINILRKQHIIDGEPDGLIMRHFEVPGAGGSLLSTRGGGATHLFPEGETGEYFADVAECVDKAKYYIANSAARRQLADRAHARVATEHQYTHRALKILQMLGDCREIEQTAAVR
jgi:spore maturation protein CgeB